MLLSFLSLSKSSLLFSFIFPRENLSCSCYHLYNLPCIFWSSENYNWYKWERKHRKPTHIYKNLEFLSYYFYMKMGLPWTGTIVFIDFHLFLSLSWIRRFMEERCYSFRILKPFWNKLERDFLIEEKNFIEFPILLHSLIIPGPHWHIFLYN